MRTRTKRTTSGGGIGKDEKTMKVYSGKLQAGDVIVYENNKNKLTQEKADELNENYASQGRSDVIAWLLQEPTAIECIKRKAPKAAESEYKRRVEAALARIDGKNASGLPILEELRQILEGKR